MEEVKKIDTELENLNLELTPKDIASGLKIIEGKKEVTTTGWKIDETQFNPPVVGPRTGKFKVKDLDKVCEIVLQEYGLKTRVAKRLGISMPTLYKMIERSQKLKEAFEVATDKILDIAESSLIEKVLLKDVQATLFLLRTVGAKRGYTEKVDVKLPDKPVFIMKRKPVKGEKEDA